MSPYDMMVKRLGFKKCPDCEKTLKIDGDEAYCPECGATFSLAIRDKSRDRRKKTKGDYRKKSHRNFDF